MGKTSKIAVVLAVIIAVYAVSPRFLAPKKWHMQQLSSVGCCSSEESGIAGIVKEAVQAVGSSLNLDSECSKPFRYAIGAVDPRFDIGRDELKADMLESEAVWEKYAQKDLLQYDEQSEFKVNLVFDDRQKATLKSQELEGKLTEIESLRKGISKEYDALSDEYEKKKARYESGVKKYQELADEYEKQVAYWNAKGGAPEEEYERLQQQKEDADDLADSLEKQRKALNGIVDRLNALAKKEKQIVSGYNKDVATYESKYGEEKEFDQGVYTGTEINIYQFSDDKDLILVLAHELGHALGMGHVENPKSIMYYLMAKQDIDHLAPSAEDLDALSIRCR